MGNLEVREYLSQQTNILPSPFEAQIVDSNEEVKGMVKNDNVETISL